MPEVQKKTVRDIEIVAPEIKVKSRIAKTTWFIILSAPLPFYWPYRYLKFCKWAGSSLRKRTNLLMARYSVFFAVLVTTLFWLYYGGSFFYLLAVYAWQVITMSGAFAIALSWNFFHIAEESAGKRFLLARKQIENQKGFILISTLLGFLFITILKDLPGNCPFPFFGDEATSGRQIIFVLSSGGVFNIAMNIMAWKKLCIPDRMAMTFKDNPRLSYKDIADSNANSFVLGATGMTYVRSEWYSDTKKKNFVLYADIETGVRDYVTYLAWCASKNPNTVMVFCDAGMGSALDFPAKLQCPEIAVLNTSTQVNKFFVWLNAEFRERYKHRRKNFSLPQPRIVVFLDDQSSDGIVFENEDNPTLRAIKNKQQLLVDGKSQNIHFIAVAPPSRRPADMPIELNPYFEPILFYYRVRYRASVSQIRETGRVWEVEESPIAYYKSEHKGKFLDVFGIWTNDGLIRCRAPYIPEEIALPEIRENLMQANESTKAIIQQTKNLDDYEATQLNTYYDRFESHGERIVLKPEAEKDEVDEFDIASVAENSGNNGKHVKQESVAKELELRET